MLILQTPAASMTVMATGKPSGMIETEIEMTKISICIMNLPETIPMTKRRAFTPTVIMIIIFERFRMFVLSGISVSIEDTSLAI